MLHYTLINFDAAVCRRFTANKEAAHLLNGYETTIGYSFVRRHSVTICEISKFPANLRPNTFNILLLMMKPLVVRNFGCSAVTNEGDETKYK